MSFEIFLMKLFHFIAGLVGDDLCTRRPILRVNRKMAVYLVVKRLATPKLSGRMKFYNWHGVHMGLRDVLHGHLRGDVSLGISRQHYRRAGMLYSHTKIFLSSPVETNRWSSSMKVTELTGWR